MMPGYEIDRFVGLSEDEKSELVCCICQDIFKCPVVANCCLQTFCEDCINDWLKTNSHCPYDRKMLIKSELNRPPRILMNLLGKLKIQCNHRERGCDEVLLLDNLAQHSLSCQFNLENWRKCEKCSCDWFIESNHDCVHSLLEIIKNANEEIKELKIRNEATAVGNDNGNTSAQINALKKNTESEEAEIRKLKLESVELSRKLKDSDLEKENFLKTLQELSDKQNISAQNENSLSQEIRKLKLEKTELSRNLKDSNLAKKKISKTLQELSDNQNSNLKELSDKQILIEARKHVSNPKITKKETTEEVTDKILHIVKEGIRKSKNLFSLCNNIKDKLDHEFGQDWHCFASFDNKFNYSYAYETGYMINIEYGTLSMELFKTEYFDWATFRKRYHSGKINQKIEIRWTDMSQKMISNVTLTIFQAFNRFDSLFEICKDISKTMEHDFGGKWHCCAYRLGDSFFQQLRGKYFSSNIAELNITVFRANQ